MTDGQDLPGPAKVAPETVSPPTPVLDRTNALLTQIEKHPIKSIGLAAAVVATVAWGFFDLIHRRDLAELERYRALGASPEQLRGRLDAKANEQCGVRRLALSRADLDRSFEFVCGETTYSWRVVRGEDNKIAESCGGAMVRSVENVAHDAFQFQIHARNEKGVRVDCVIPGNEATTTEWMSTCECPFIATNPKVDATGEVIELKAIFEPL
ncbi:MAG: hypothetical protein JNM17_08165 [Archangium sp.]|nr:hypothetical protein [Archangium sp.]